MLGHQLADVVQPGLLILAAVALERIRRQQVPLGRAGAQRARGDHLDARLQQIVPALDFLRVALADHQRDHRAERDALGDVGVPVGGDLVGLDQTRHVGLHREVHQVGGLAVGHRAGLVTGGAVGGGDGEVLAGRGGLEGRDDLAPARLRHRVGDQVQGGLGVLLARARDVAGTAAAAGGQDGRGGGDGRGGSPAACGGGEHVEPFSLGPAYGSEPVTTTMAVIRRMAVRHQNRRRAAGCQRQQTTTTDATEALLKSVVERTVGSVTEPRRTGRSAIEQPHHDDEQQKCHQGQRHPGPRHAAHGSISRSPRRRRSVLIPRPSAASVPTAIP